MKWHWWSPFLLLSKQERWQAVPSYEQDRKTGWETLSSLAFASEICLKNTHCSQDRTCSIQASDLEKGAGDSWQMLPHQNTAGLSHGRGTRQVKGTEQHISLKNASLNWVLFGNTWLARITETPLLLGSYSKTQHRKAASLGHHSPVACRYYQPAGYRMIAFLWLIRRNSLVSNANAGRLRAALLPPPKSSRA